MIYGCLLFLKKIHIILMKIFQRIQLSIIFVEETCYIPKEHVSLFHDFLFFHDFLLFIRKFIGS
jgi:hypothetical protein